MDDLTALERQVADEIFRIVGPARPVDDAEVVETATTRSPVWRFPAMFDAAKFAVAGAIVALFGGLLLTGVLTQNEDETPPFVGASASVPAETDRNATPAPATSPTVTDVIEVGSGTVTDLVETADAVWVAGPGPDGQAALTRIDKTSREVTDRIDLLDGAPSGGELRLIEAGDAIWVVDRAADVVDRVADRESPNVFRVDPVTRTVSAALVIGNVSAPPIVADGSVWLWTAHGQADEHPDGRLVEIDLATNEVRAERPAPAGAIGWATDMAVHDGTIWMVVGWEGIVSFDLATRRFGDFLPLSSGKQGFDKLYPFDDAIVLEDAQTEAHGWVDLPSLDATAVPLPMRGKRLRSTSAPGAIWTAYRDQREDRRSTLHRIDVEKRRITANLPLNGAQPMFPAYADGVLWIPFEGGRVSRIDTQARELTHDIKTGVKGLVRAYPSANAVWVTADSKVVRIATE